MTPDEIRAKGMGIKLNDQVPVSEIHADIARMYGEEWDLRKAPCKPTGPRLWLSDAEYENVLHNLAAWEKSEEAQLRAEYEMCQQSRMYQHCRAERLLTAVWVLSGLVVALGVVLAGVSLG